MKPLDEKFPIELQLGIEVAPVVLVNLFTLDPAAEERFLEEWKHDADFMKRQPGFISTQLHRALGSSPTYPASIVARPHLFQKIGVAGICTA